MEMLKAIHNLPQQWESNCVAFNNQLTALPDRMLAKNLLVIIDRLISLCKSQGKQKILMKKRILIISIN